MRNLFQRPAPATAVRPAILEKQITDAQYDFFRKLVYERSRINLGQNKRELVVARVSKRLRALDMQSFQQYIDFLQSTQGKEELTHLIDVISTNHTYFFREQAHFDFLLQNVLPPITQNRHGALGKTFRVWSAATSSGEEPYSIAILLQEYFARLSGWNWRIECTDISTRILARAKEGHFNQERLKLLRPEWMQRYFEKLKESKLPVFAASPLLKRNMGFTALNLLGGAYPFREPFDVIFCRNVMIYFDRATQQELVQRMTPLIKPGGYLMIGHSESLNGIQHSLKMVKPAIYHKADT